MSPFWLLFATSLAVLLAFAGMIWMRLGTRNGFSARELQDALSFSIDKYRPMERLLCRDDADFLRAQPGFQPSMLNTLRHDRQRIFRTYLRSIRRDFDGLYLAARQAVLLSDLEQSGLLQAILRQRVVFYWAIGLIQARLVLYGFGVGTVDIRPVLQALENMREAAVSLNPVPAGA